MADITIDTSYWMAASCKKGCAAGYIQHFVFDSEDRLALDKRKKILQEYLGQKLHQDIRVQPLLGYLLSREERINSEYSEDVEAVSKSLRIHKCQYITKADYTIACVAFQTESRILATDNTKHFCKCKWLTGVLNIATP
jgi:hypothetical protein